MNATTYKLYQLYQSWNSIIISVFLIFALLLTSGCAVAGEVAVQSAPLDGQILPVQLGTTLWGIRHAIAGRSGTMIMMKEQLVMFMWALNDGWAFAVLDGGSKTAVQDFAKIAQSGNFVNARTMGDLADFLKGHGWEIVGAEAVPAAIKTAATSAGTWMTMMAGNMVTFVVFPPGTVVTPEKLESMGLRVIDG